MKTKTKRKIMMIIAILFVASAILGLTLPLWGLSRLLQIIIFIIAILSISVFCWADSEE